MIKLTWYSLKDIYEQKVSFQESCGIYCIRNKINNKTYIGKTSKLILDRIHSHIYQSLFGKKQYAFQKAIKKYGVGSFEICILVTCKIEDLNELEKKFIKEFQSMEHGYNLTSGGEKDYGCKSNPETGKKISAAKKNVPLPLWARKNLMKPVQQINMETGEIIAEFESISSAYSITKIHNIGKCCRKQLSHAGHYFWKFKNDNHFKKSSWSIDACKKMKNRLKNKNPLNKKVLQIDLKTKKIIATHNSINDAIKSTGAKNISLVCRGLRNHSGGFFWEYEK